MEVAGLKNMNSSPDVENWDDDDFDTFDNIHLRTASAATSVLSHPQLNHRDSTSSRLSIRSDSNQGDEHWDVLVDEQSSVKDALTIAKSKGIPLPSNLPRSALEGGTIRRLGGKVVKKAIADDWSEDLDFASAPTQLRLTKPEERDLSESLRQISAAFHASPKSPEEKNILDTIKSPKSRLAATPLSLEHFRDIDEDGDFGDVPTIRVAKHRSPQKLQPVQTASLQPSPDELEDGLEIPSDGKLRLSTKKLSPRTPLAVDDFDAEWAEGSLGTRHAGTRRAGMSNRSSSISAMSPSVSSAFTVESEEDGLDGLVLPQGPVNFNDILKRRQDSEKENLAPQQFSSPQQTKPVQPLLKEEDWTEDLVIPNGKAFDNARLTLHRNVKVKNQRSTSPSKIKTTTLNFTSSKTSGSMPRPRFGFGHERQERPRSHLEPVSETGAPVQRYQRPTSRLGHNTNSSISSIPAPATPTPSTPSRRDLRNATSRIDMRHQPPTTTNAQLLRAKRSIPTIDSISSPTRSTFNRPPSRQDGSSSRLRPRSPERPESRLGIDRRNAPFLPAGASISQSQHVSIKTSAPRSIRRTDSDGSGEHMTAAQKSLSRLAGVRPQTPGKGRSDYSIAELAAQAKKTMNKPLRRRNWGDGSELESFDDLPTSVTAEAKYTKMPIARGPPRSLRSKIGQQSQAAMSSTSLVSVRSGTETPVPSTPLSPPRLHDAPAHHPSSNMPRFARDTAASRIAREQTRSFSTTFHNMRGEPLQPVSTNAKATIISKPTYGSSLRRKKPVQQKPHLIKPLGGEYNRPKEEKGMYYNPVLCRWEGNDTALTPFDVPDFLPQQPSPGDARNPNIKVGSTVELSSPAQPTGKPNLALIMNVGSTTGVQLVNGMVFDPRQMKWLKVAHGERGDSIRSGTGSVQLEEEEDVFAGLEDLKEESENMSSMHGDTRDRSVSAIDPFAASDDKLVIGDEEDAAHVSGHSGDEFAVSEEFDVGPEFVRRQRSEEDRWRRKVEKWLRSEAEVAEDDVEGPSGWRWAVRDFFSAGEGASTAQGLMITV